MNLMLNFMAMINININIMGTVNGTVTTVNNTNVNNNTNNNNNNNNNNNGGTGTGGGRNNNNNNNNNNNRRRKRNVAVTGLAGLNELRMQGILSEDRQLISYSNIESRLFLSVIITHICTIPNIRPKHSARKRPQVRENDQGQQSSDSSVRLVGGKSEINLLLTRFTSMSLSLHAGKKRKSLGVIHFWGPLWDALFSACRKSQMLHLFVKKVENYCSKVGAVYSKCSMTSWCHSL